MNKFFLYLSTPEKNGKKIGLFRTLTAIFGGLIASYLGMTLLAFVLPMPVQESAIVSIMLNTTAWAIMATWIVLSYTKLSALLKFLIPTILFSVALYIFA